MDALIGPGERSSPSVASQHQIPVKQKAPADKPGLLTLVSSSVAGRRVIVGSRFSALIATAAAVCGTGVVLAGAARHCLTFTGFAAACRGLFVAH